MELYILGEKISQVNYLIINTKIINSTLNLLTKNENNLVYQK